MMKIIQQTEETLAFVLQEKQFLAIALQGGGMLMVVGVILLGADFTNNPEYDPLSAQNLNWLLKMLGVLAGILGLTVLFTGISHQDEAYLFDKEHQTLMVKGRNWFQSYQKEYGFSEITTVEVFKTDAIRSEDLPEGYSVAGSNSDSFQIVLQLEDPSSAVFLQYRSSDREFITTLAEGIGQFIGRPVVKRG